MTIGLIAARELSARARDPVPPLAVTAATSGLIRALAALTFAWTLPAWPDATRERAIDVSFVAMTPPPAEMAPPLAVATDEPPPPAMPPQRVEPAPDLTAAAIEQALLPVEEPPPFSTRALVRAVPAPPPRQRPTSTPSPPSAAQRELAPVADTGHASRQVAQEDYLVGLIQKLSRYRFVPTAQQASAHGVVVARVTIARDGSVLDVALLRSSGFAALDQGLVETIRRASPFAPLPGELQGTRASFTVPIAYDRER